ncbi:hypothetical protein ACN077_24245 [Clostridium chromiireducens]|uniref:hypothetical protein n=1 Tax=Clostridium chromiireducens TaxID=225345 RepID=UPI003AF7706E
MNDVIDALSLAVMGAIGLVNKFETIPKKPMKDSRGIKMQMIYGEFNKVENKVNGSI